MKTITEILRDNGATGWQGTDKQREHQYGPVYDSLFSDREAVTAVLELGIYYGGSLLCWREAFPNAVIVGLDSDPCAGFNPPDRVEKHVGRQTGYGDLMRAVAGRTFDLIIDDASHLLADQLTSLFMLWPSLKTGGYYVIEEFGIQDAFGAACRWQENVKLFDNCRIAETPGPGGPEYLVVLHKEKT